MNTHSVILLRFRVENHRSLRDEVEVSFMRSNRKQVDGDWIASTVRAAGVYGANASGKSTILNALSLFRAAIEHSATLWTGRRKGIPYEPFRLDEKSKLLPSTYAVDFIFENTRYEYGFSVFKGDVQAEWLYSYPEKRARMLFERGPDVESGIKFGASFKGGTVELLRSTLSSQLLLSRGATSRHPLLTPLHDALVDGIVITTFVDSDRDGRISAISSGLQSGEIEFNDIIALLRVADVGISNLEVETHEVPEEIQRMIQAMVEAGNGFRKDKKNKKDSTASDLAELSDSEERTFELGIEAVIQNNLKFHHTGVGGKAYALPARVQSTGTMSWLSLAAPALECLRSGKILVIDEIDASLHPKLASSLIQMFRDTDTNSHGAQILFSTHDTYFLSPSTSLPLSDEEVWFAEKNDGVTDIYSLRDFSSRKNENIARRYLAGRYGAIPAVAPSIVASLVDDEPILSVDGLDEA